MSLEEFNKANETVHPVEGESHYPKLTKYGFTPITKEAVGFVRSYDYQHPNGATVRWSTGVNADYWSGKLADGQTGGGYWPALDVWLEQHFTKQ